MKGSKREGRLGGRKWPQAEIVGGVLFVCLCPDIISNLIFSLLRVELYLWARGDGGRSVCHDLGPCSSGCMK